ncbi:MAG: DUF1828 domain-containing protein [Synergistaceae bacterium]|jgi:hypothetical protein|nr:DUF1828 domain-containing protein [Synergistaceae bacterium]
MFPEDLVTLLRDSLCAEVSVKSRGRDDYRVFVPFYFSDGDSPKIVLKKTGDDSFLLTDEGHTLMYLSYYDINIDNSLARRALLEKILSSHFMEDRDGRIVMSNIVSKDVAASVFTFTQGLLKIADMTLWKKDRLKSMLMENFRQSITSLINHGARISNAASNNRYSLLLVRYGFSIVCQPFLLFHMKLSSVYQIGGLYLFFLTPSLPTTFAKEPLRHMLKRLRDYKAAYTLFINNYDAPFMNNQAERDLRPCKMKQKVSGCFRSWLGVEAFAAISSYFSILKKSSYNLLSSVLSLL